MAIRSRLPESTDYRVYLVRAVLFFLCGITVTPVFLTSTSASLKVVLVLFLLEFLLFAGYNVVKAWLVYWKFSIQDSLESIAIREFERCEYFPKIGFSEQAILEKNFLARPGKKFKSHDMLRGEYNGVPFKTAFVRYGGFRGVVMELTYPEEHFDGVRIQSMDFAADRKRKLFAKEHDMRLYDGSMRNGENLFQCYCRNGEQAETVVTPSAMKALRRIRKELRFPFMISYRENEMVVVIRTDCVASTGEPGYSLPMEEPGWEKAERIARSIKCFGDFLLRDYSIMADMTDIELPEPGGRMRGGRR